MMRIVHSWRKEFEICPKGSQLLHRPYLLFVWEDVLRSVFIDRKQTGKLSSLQDTFLEFRYVNKSMQALCKSNGGKLFLQKRRMDQMYAAGEALDVDIAGN